MDRRRKKREFGYVGQDQFPLWAASVVAVGVALAVFAAVRTARS